MAEVKGARTTRADRALATRRRMTESARDLFVDQGYPATTMDEIAERAGVAVQTLYYSFRTKGRLLCEVMDVAAAGGPGAAPVTERPWMAEAMSTRSAQRALALAVEHGADIFVQAAPLWPAMTAALGDPEVDSYWQGVADGRRRGQAGLVGRLDELGALRPGLPVDRATDLLVTQFGHDVYRSLVVEAGWSVAAYKAWLLSALVHQLLGRSRPSAAAYAGLSYESSLATASGAT